MNEVWDLTPLYKGFDDPAYEADMAAMKALVADFTAFSKELPNMEPVAGLRRGVELLEKLAEQYGDGKGQHVLIGVTRGHVPGGFGASIQFFLIQSFHTLILHFFSEENNTIIEYIFGIM